MALKGEELEAYKAAHSIPNAEHSAVLEAKDRELAVAAFQLKEAEAAVDVVEAKCRKLTREKKFLSDELQEVGVLVSFCLASSLDASTYVSQ